MDTYEKTRRILASNIRAARARARLSQEGLALEATVDRTFISQIEREVGNPSLRTLCQIADALKTSVTELLLPPPPRLR